MSGSNPVQKWNRKSWIVRASNDILWSVADENLRRALITFENKPFWYFLSSPIATLLMAVSVFTFYDGIFRRGRAKKT